VPAEEWEEAEVRVGVEWEAPSAEVPGGIVFARIVERKSPISVGFLAIPYPAHAVERKW